MTEEYVEQSETESTMSQTIDSNFQDRVEPYYEHESDYQNESDEEHDIEPNKQQESEQVEDDTSLIQHINGNDDESDVDNNDNHPPIVYDIDQIMEKRRAERRRRRKFDPETLSEIDDIACQTVDKMKLCAKDDRILNEQKLPALNKLKFVDTVQDNVLKAGALNIMLQNDLLSAIREWLSPLPDKSLPNAKIRNAMIDILEQLTNVNVDMLRDSRVGRVVMLLAKHPRETRQNQDRLWRLINDWSRSIFDLNDCDDSFSKEERQQRDIERLPSMVKKRKLLLEGNPSLAKVFASRQSKDLSSDSPVLSNKRAALMRARVPNPAACDYVYRPTSKILEHSNSISQSQNQRLDQMKRIVKQCKSKRHRSSLCPTGPKGGVF